MEKSVAIVTGASSGIGKATALRLARSFGAVALVARNRDALQATAEAVEGLGAAPLVIAADLGVSVAASAVVEGVVQAFGRIDAVLNIAGAVPGIDLFELTDEQWDVAAALKLHGARRLAIAAWPALMAAKGSVIFTSGTAGEMPVAAQAAVGTINAAITALAKAFAERGLADGVQVNTVSPGAVMTGRREALIGKAAAAKGITVDEARRGFLQRSGIARFGEPEEVADLMAYLVSPQAKWISGSTFRIDGGEIRTT